MNDRIKAPFPWFGGKSRAADLIWERLGDPVNYVEPFAGSLAVLLARLTVPGNEIVNDLDCYVANAWRAMKFAPDDVANHCDWPVNEADLHARHRWLHGRKEFRERMEHDPDYFDARIAAWWIWGLSCWIGGNFCRPSRQDALPHLTGGKGVARKVPHLTGGKGVARKVPHLTGGKESPMFATDDQCPPSAPPDGWSRGGAQSETSSQLPCITGTYGAQTHKGKPMGRGVVKLQGDALQAWFAAIADRLRFTKVCCGGWERVLTKAATFGQGLTGVLLDPPYEADGDSHDDVYGEMSRGVSGAVREWALANGNNPDLRIALCGYEGEHPMPAEWECVAWKAAGGYASAAGNSDNSKRERIWLLHINSCPAFTHRENTPRTGRR